MVNTGAVQPGAGGSSGPTGAGGEPSPFASASSSGSSVNAAWVQFAQKLDPSEPFPQQYVAGLIRNMMSSINNVISEIKARWEREKAAEREMNPPSQ